MAAAELRGGDKPSLNEALTWIGFRVDDIYGAGVGSLEDVWIDPGTGTPRWLLVTEGRFDGRATLVPFGDATPGAGHVWVPYDREIVWQAPQVQRGVPLTPQVEATLRNHYAANVAAAVSHRSPFAGGSEPQGGRPEGHQRAHRATVRLASSPPAPWEVRPDPGREEAPIPPPRLPHRPAPPVSGSQPEAAPRTTEGAQAPPTSYGNWSPGEQPTQPEPTQPPPPIGYGGQEQYPPQQQPWQQPQQPQQQHWSPDPLDTLSDLPPGHQIEIEIEGNLTISGQLRGVRIIPPGPPRPPA